VLDHALIRARLIERAVCRERVPLGMTANEPQAIPKRPSLGVGGPEERSTTLDVNEAPNPSAQSIPQNLIPKFFLFQNSILHVNIYYIIVR
jgi:hypothetical protein